VRTMAPSSQDRHVAKRRDSVSRLNTSAIPQKLRWFEYVAWQNRQGQSRKCSETPGIPPAEPGTVHAI
jgi:hypothetical protein